MAEERVESINFVDEVLFPIQRDMYDSYFTSYEMDRIRRSRTGDIWTEYSREFGGGGGSSGGGSGGFSFDFDSGGSSGSW